MNKLSLVATLALLLASTVCARTQAQTTANLAIKVCSSASGAQVCNYVPVDDGNPLPVVAGTNLPITTIPPKLTAYGILSVTAASVALSTLTVGPNSAAWSTTYPSNYVSIRNSNLSAGVVYVCWFGGTCSASVGDPVAIGQSATRNVGNAVSPTLYASSTATVTGAE